MTRLTWYDLSSRSLHDVVHPRLHESANGGRSSQVFQIPAVPSALAAKYVIPASVCLRSAIKGIIKTCTPSRITTLLAYWFCVRNSPLSLSLSKSFNRSLSFCIYCYACGFCHFPLHFPFIRNLGICFPLQNLLSQVID